MGDQNGVLPSQWIRAAIADGIIAGEPAIAPAQIQPNSLDLRVGKMGYRVQSSFLPGGEGMKVKLGRLKLYNCPIGEDGIFLERNQACIFHLCESVDLPDNVYARANPKSSTGRLDIFTRLVTEYGTAFDEVPRGYKGSLYLEVVPRSFAVHLRTGDCLAQIRFQVGNPYLTQAETIALLNSDDIIYDPVLTRPLRANDLPVSSGVVLSVSVPKKLVSDPTKDQIKVGYRARKNTKPIDLRILRELTIRQYWDTIYGDNRPVILEPDEFYIFASRELVRLPPEFCGEMVPFDAGSGELRTHYAGFFDSGFGFAPNRPADQTAAAVVLEIRSRDVPFLIEDAQPLFRLNILKSTEPPDFLYGSGIGSNYQSQRLRLSKQFRPQKSGLEEREEVEEHEEDAPNLSLDLFSVS
jgi:dCTP deaminase